MNDGQISGRLAWLSSALAVQRNGLASILLRLKGIGLKAGTSITLHLKFMRLLEQVATDKQKELNIINEIEAVEQHHQMMKQMKRLRRAAPENAARHVLRPEASAERPHHGGIVSFFWALYLLSLSKINNKKQSFTIN